MHTSALLRAGLALTFVAVLAACGGGGGGSVAPGGGPAVTPSPSPAPGRSSAASATVAAGPTTLTFPALVNGVSGALTLPPASSGAGATVSGTLSLDPPAFVTTPLQSAARSARATFVRSGKRTASATHTAVAYIAFSASQALGVSGALTVDLSLPGSVAAQPYFLSFYDGTGWQYDVAGPSSPASSTIGFTVQTQGGGLFAAGKSYAFAITTDVTPAPTSTPAPSPSPSPSLPPQLPSASFRSYALTGAGPYGILAAPDGVWLTESTQNDLAKLTAGGVVTTYPLGAAGPAGIEPLSLVSAPDGTIWIALHHANAIAHASSSGPLLATLPTGDTGGPRNIAYGGDGNLWYTQDNGPTLVGRMTPAGSVAHFAIGSIARDIAAAPDGTLWVAADTAVVRLTTAGDVTSYPETAPLQGGSFSSICAAADGTVWAAVSNLPTPSVVKIGSSGAMTAYAIATPASRGWRTARIGCFGSSVFLAQSDPPVAQPGPTNDTAILAQIAADGTVTQLWQIPAPPGGSVPDVSGMALGPDQNLWFVDDANGTIDVWVLH
jgi:streptogramin lyase